ncbi:MAG: hypothetical protein PVF05_09180 [Gemmatimonadales bacterium]
MFALALAFAALLLGPGPVAAQEESPPVAPVADSARTDSAAVSVLRRPAPPDSVERPSGPSPMSAFFRSVLVPGWGQLAADQPGRAVFYFVAQSATMFMVLRTNHRIGEAESEELKQARRSQREDWLVLAGFWALASGVDAWVSAQMWGFEGEVVPPPDGSAGVALRLRVPTRLF